MVMVGMVVMSVLSVGLRSFHVTLHVSHDQAQQIGHFSNFRTAKATALHNPGFQAITRDRQRLNMDSGELCEQAIQQSS
jgi:hypothetical protein